MDFVINDLSLPLAFAGSIGEIDTLSFSSFTSALSFNLSGTIGGLLQIQVSDGVDSALIETDSIERIIGGSANDIFTFESFGDSETPFSNVDDLLRLEGGAGTDAIVVSGDVLIGDASLFLESETISVASSANISTTNNVVLNAIAASAFAGSTAPLNPLNLIAGITVSGSITGNAVALNSAVDNTLELNGVATSFALDSVSSATTIVDSTASITASTLEVTAETNTSFDLSVIGVTVGSIKLGSLSNPIAQTTYAAIEGGAQISVGTTAISADEPSSILVRATDTTDIQTSISTDTSAITQFTGFDAVFGETYLSRDTKAYVGDADQQAIVNGGNAETAAGGLKVLAENRNGAGGGVVGNISSDFLGVQTTEVSQDDAIAYVENADIKTEQLEVIATNSSAYSSTAKATQNKVSGSTQAYIIDSRISTQSVAGTQSVILSAIDQSAFTAHSDDLPDSNTDFSSLDVIDITGVFALNRIQKSTQAYVRNSNIESATGLISVEAKSDFTATATGDTLSITNGGFFDLTNLGFTGSLVINEVDGGVSASVEDSTILANGSDADVVVDAQNTSEISAIAKAGAVSNGGSGVAVGANIATNVIGSEIDNILEATVDTLLGTPSEPSDESNSDTKAFIKNSDVVTDGGIAVSAESSQQINSSVSNISDSSASGIIDAAGAAVGAVLASNTIAGQTLAFVAANDDSTKKTIEANRGLSVKAKAAAAIDATITLSAKSETSAALPTSNNDSIGVAAAFSVNEVSGGTKAYISDLDVDVVNGDVSITADTTSTLEANLSTEASSSGGSQFGEGTSIAVNGIVATNVARGETEAKVEDSDIVASGDVSVKASNTSSVDATVENATTSGDAAIGVTVAFNSVGYESADILSNSVDALLGKSVLGTDEASGATAFISDTAANAGGEVTADAESAVSMNSSVSNTTESAASALTGATGLSVGTVVASNKAASAAEAYIENSNELSTVSVAGDSGVSVTATDSSSVDAEVLLKAASETSNENPFSDSDSIGVAAAVVMNDVKGGAKSRINNVDIDAASGDVNVSASTTSTLEANLSTEASSSGGSKFGEGTSIAVNGMVATNVARGETEAKVEDSNVAAGGDVSVKANNTSSVDATVENATTSGDTAIGVTVAFNSVGYESADILSNSVDALLGKSVLGVDEASGATAFISDTTVDADGAVDVAATAASSMKSSVSNTTESSASALTSATGLSVGTVVASNKAASAAEAYIESTEAQGSVSGDDGVSVSAIDGSSIDAEVSLAAASETSNTNPFSNSDSIGVAAAVVMNDVDGSANSRIDNIDVDAANGDVSVTANTTSTLKADLSTAASSSGGSKFGEGTSIAVNGMVATNVASGTTEAKVEDSDVAAGGDVSVKASNTSSVNAIVENATTSGDAAVGVTVAFNSVGYESEDILSNSVDALLGKSVLGTDTASGATAFISDTTVDAGGAVAVEAEAAATMQASVSNTTESAASALTGATGLSVGTVVVSNKAASAAEAYIENTGTQGSVSGDDGVSVSATDGSSISASLSLEAASETSNTNPFSNSDSIGVAAAVVMNDVKGGAKSRIDNINVGAANGDVSVTANTTSTLTAKLSTEASSSGGSKFGDGTSIAVNGMVATNVARGETEAKVEDSDVTAGNNVNVAAVNTSSVDATVENATTSGDTAVGVTVAFNSVGYESEDILSNSVDTLLGTSVLGTDEASGATAFISDTTVDAEGAVDVLAIAASSMNSSVSNTTESSASALTGATGLSIGTVIVSNKAASAAEAYVESNEEQGSVSGDKGISVSATDGSSVDASLSLEAASETSNTNPFSNSDSIGVAAAVVMNDVKGGATSRIDNIDIDAANGDVTVDASTTGSLTAKLSTEASSSGGSKFGEGTSIAVNGMVATNVARGETEAKVEGSNVVAGGNVEVKASNTSSVDATVENATTSGDTAVGVTVAFNSVGYESADILSNSVDALLGKSVLGTDEASGATAFISDTTVDADGAIDVAATAASSMKSSVSNTTESSASALTSATGLSVGTVVASNKAASAAEAYIESTGVQGSVSGDAGVSVSATDGSSIDAEVSLKAASETSNTNPFSNSDSIGVAAAVVMNDVDGGAKSRVNGIDVDAVNGDVIVTADTTSTIKAKLSTEASSSGGSKFGDGTSIAVNGMVATNVARGETEAKVEDSDVTAGNNVNVAASNTSSVDATVENATTSGDTAVGVTVAFNSVGYESTDILSNSVDALLGKSVLGKDEASGATAFISDTAVDAGGAVTVEAEAAATMQASVSNTTESAASALTGAAGLSVGTVVVSNKAASAAEAYIESTETQGSVSGDAGVSVSATDSSSISASLSLEAASETSNTNPFSNSDSIGVAAAVVMNDVKGGAKSRVDNINVGAANGDVSVTANTTSTLTAKLSTEASSSGGSKFGDGTSIAVNGMVATNVARGETEAKVEDSDVAAGGDVNVRADNTSSVDATVENATTSGDTAVGVTVAFNSVGYESEDILSNSVDALLGTSVLGTDEASGATAFISDTTVDADGAIDVAATAASSMKSSVSNTTESSASALTSATGLSVGTVVASNKAASAAEAYIENISELSTISVSGDNGVSVSATDSSSINAEVSLEADSETSNENPFSNSDSIGVAAAVVMNDVKGGAKSRMNNIDVDAANGDVTVEASTTGSLTAQLSTEASSSGGSKFGEGTSVAVNGMVATNVARGETEAKVEDSDITAGGDVIAKASNTSSVDATVENATTSGDTAVGVTVAFNSVGYESADILSNSVDVLLGKSVLGTDEASGATAFISNTTVDADGAIDVAATAASSMKSSVSNTTESAASALTSATGLSVGTVVASNKAASAAEAYIENSNELSTVSIVGDNGVSVSATDSSSINAEVSLEADSETSNENPFSNSDSIGVAAAVVMNDVKGGAKSRMNNIDVDAANGDVTVEASTTGSLTANLSTEASSSGGSKFGEGTSVAVNGMVATNVARGETEAKVEDSDITAGGDINVAASNTSTVDATVENATTSGDAAIGVTVAFNSVGYESVDILSNSVDVLLGKSVLGTDEASGATAFISNTTVDADGAIAVDAESAVSMNSSVSNTTESSASALTGATGLSVGTVVASNKAASAAEAYIESTEEQSSVSGNDGVAVSATDGSSIDATVTLEAASETSNTNPFSNSDSIGVAAAVVMNDVTGGAKSRVNNIDIDAANGDATVDASTTGSLVAKLSTEASSSGGSKFGEGTSIAVNGMVATNVARGETEAKVEDSDVVAGSDVNVRANNTSSVDATVENATTSGDAAIGVTVAFNSVGYESEDILSNSVDALLGASILGTDEASGATAFISDTAVDADGAIDVAATAASSMDSLVSNTTESSASALTGATGLSVGTVVTSNKAASAAEAYIESNGEQISISGDNGVSITATDDSNFDATVSLKAASETSNTNPFSNSDSIGVAAAVVLNDVKGGATSNIENAAVTAMDGDVLIQSEATSTLDASLSVEAASSGGSKFGEGISIAVGGLIATNVMQGGAEAGATNTTIDTSTASELKGDVTIAATNSSKLTATTENAVTSGDTAVGVTLAFNSIGHDAQNVLFNTIDTLIGDPAIADAFDSEGGADARAFMLNSSVDAAGQLSVQAAAATELDSVVTNETESAAGALTGAAGAAVGVVFASNRVNSAAVSSVDYSDTFSGEKTIETGRGMEVSAADNASIDANIKLSTSSVTENTDPFSDSDSYGVSGLVSLNEVKGGASATVNDATVTATSGDVSVSATENATLNAVVDSVTKSEGGSKFGSGTSLAAAGVIATNLVNSSTNAILSNSGVTTEDTAIDSGNVSVEAENTSAITANINNSVESAETSVGVTLAYNTVGYDSQNFLFNTVDALLGTDIGGSQPVDVQASIQGSDVQAAGALSVSANSDVSVDAKIETSATAVNATAGDSSAISVGGNITMNRMAVQTSATIEEGSDITVQAGDLAVQATDASNITSNVQAPVLAASLGTESTAVAVGLSTARNTVDSDVEASIHSSTSSDQNSVTVTNGSVLVEAEQASNISSTAAASAVGISGGTTGGPAVSGGGAIAQNTIAGGTKAYLEHTDIADSSAVSLSAKDSATIASTVESAATAVAFGTETTPAVAIGVSIASNEIGEEGDERNPVEVKAYTKDSNIETKGELSVAATANSNISATVKATTVAVGASSDSSVGVSGAGIITSNEIITDVAAQIDTAEQIKTNGDVNVTAANTSSVSADTQAVSVGASLAGSNATSVSIGLSSARNRIGNFISAKVKNVGRFLTGSNDINVTASESASIEAKSVAAAVSVGMGGSNGVAVSGGGAESTNIILSSTEATVEDSNLGSQEDKVGDVALSAESTSTIDAEVGAVAGSVSFGGTTGVGVALGASMARNLVGYDLDEYGLGSEKVESGVQAKLIDTSVQAEGDLRQQAIAAQTVDAQVLAGSVALSGGGTTGVALGGAGVVALNEIGATVNAQIDGDGAEGIEAASVALNAADTSEISSDAGAASLAGSVGGTTGVAAAVGISLSKNEIDNQVTASIDNADEGVTTTNGSVVLNATEAAEITVQAAAASAAVAFGGTTGVALSGAGADATNQISIQTSASASDSVIDSANEVTLNAVDTSTIDATIAAASAAASGGGTAGVGASIGAAVARNLIGYDSDGNKLESGVEAKLSDTSVRAEGALSQSAIANQTVEAQVLAGSVALSGGGTAGVALSGGGVSATNQIGTTVNAQIDGDGAAGIEAASISLEATDASTISSDAGAASLAGSVGGTAGVSASIGVSLAKNEISNEITASIDNADSGVTTTAGDITLTASETADITVTSAAASASAAIAGTAGIALSGAGAEATNVISNKTSANSSNSRLASNNAVTLDAKDTSTIDATIVAASAAAAGGGVAGVGASIGAAVARNLIGYDSDGNKLESGVEAKISDTSVQAEGALSQSAIANQTVDAQVLAGSVAIAGGGTVGVSLSGAGVSATNKIGISVNAQIDGDGTEGIEVDSVSLQAVDNSTISSDAGAASIAGSISGAVSFDAAVGVSLAENDISNKITASIDNADDGVATSTGDIELIAEENADISVVSAAAAASASISGAVGVSLSGAGAQASNTISTETKASVNDSVLDSKGDVILSATDNSTIDATIAAVSASVGVGGTVGAGAAIGASSATNDIGGSIEATVNNTDLRADGDLLQTAKSDRSIDAEVVAGSVAIAGGTVGVSAAGAGSTVENKTSTVVKATIDGDSAANSSRIQTNDIALEATDTSTITANTEAASIAASFGAAGASVSVGSATAENQIANTIEASIKGETSVIADGDVTLKAEDSVTVEARSEGISAALAVGISGAAAVGTSSTTSKNNSSVSATIGEADAANNVTIDAGSVDVQAIGTATLEAVDIAAALAGSVIAVSVGGGFATNESNQQITALVGEGSKIDAESGVSVQATDNTETNASVGTDAGAAGLVGGSVGLSQAENSVNNTVRAAVDGANVDAGTGDVVVGAIATVSSDAEAETTSVTAALGSAVGGAAAVNNINNTVDANVSDTTMSADNVSITAEQTATVKASTGQTSAAVGGASGTAVAANNFGSSVSASSQASDIDADGNILIDADSNTTIEKNEVVGLAAGFGALAGSVGINQVSNTVIASVEDGELTAGGSAAILANSTTDVEAKGGTTSAGLVGAGGTVVTNNIDNNIQASISNDAIVNANADPNSALSVPTKDGTQTVNGLAVIATSDEDLDVDIATGAAGGFGLAAAIAVNSLTSTTQAQIKDSSVNQAQADANTGQDLYVQAFSDSDVDVTAGSAALGLAAGVGASIDITSVQTVTSATIDNVSDTRNSSGSASVLNDLVVEADAERSVNSNVAAGAAGLGLGASGAVSIVNIGSGLSAEASEAAADTESVVSEQLDKLEDDGIVSTNQDFLDSTFSSAAVEGTEASASGILNVAENMSVVANETTNLAIDSGAGSAGLVSVGGGVAIANVEQNANANIGEDSTVAVGRDLDVRATGVVNANDVTAIAGSAGLVGLGAAVVRVDSENNVSAYIGDRTDINQSGDIDITADSTSNIGADAKGAAVALAAAGIVTADAIETGTTRAFVGDEVNIRATDNLSVNAQANESVQAISQASSGGLAAVQGSVPTAEVKATVEAFIGDDSAITVSEDVSVTSDVVVDGDAYAKGFSVGLLGAGASMSEVDATTTIMTSVGDSTSITADNVTIQSRLGEPIADVDTSFNAADGNTVDLNSNSITFNNDHDLETGDQATYLTNGTQAIGGLNNQSSYQIIAVDNRTVKLGAEFDAASKVETKFNTIQFNSGHGFTTGEQVIYEAEGDSVGGLTSGSQYYVEVIDATTVKLHTSAPAGENGYEFVGSGAQVEDIENDGQSTDINIEDHGFQNSDILNYEKRTAQFSITDEIPDNATSEGSILNLYGELDSSNRIYSSSHSFENDDKVMYSTSGDVVGGLSNNNTYYIVERDDDSFKLSRTQGGNAIDLEASKELVDSVHEITAVGLKIQSVTKTNFSYDDSEDSNTINISGHGWNSGQAVVYKGTEISGLSNNQTYYVIRTSEDAVKLASSVDDASDGTAINIGSGSGQFQVMGQATDLEEGVPYYVVGRTSDSFQLATSAGGEALVLSTSGLSGSGANHIFFKDNAIDLTSTGAGTHNFHLDLQSLGSGQQKLDTGATASAPSQGDGIFSAYSQASSGGALSGNATEVSTTIRSDIKTEVGSNANITATGNVTVDGLSTLRVTGGTDSTSIGAIAVGASQLGLTVFNENHTTVGSNAQISALGDIVISGETNQQISVEGKGAAGALVPFANVDVTVNSGHNTTTTIGTNAQITAAEAAKIQSLSDINNRAKTSADGVGFYADADADTQVNFDGSNAVNVLDGASVEARELALNSTVTNFTVESRAESEGAGLIGNIDAHATTDLTGTDTQVNVGAGASLKADFLDLIATFAELNSNAVALADCDGLGGDTDSNATNIVPVSAKVFTDSQSKVTIYEMDVQSEILEQNLVTIADSDKAWELRIWTPFGTITVTMDFGSSNTNPQYSTQNTTSFNSQVEQLSREINPILIIGDDGSVQQKSDNISILSTADSIEVLDILNDESGSIEFIGAANSGSYTSTEIDPAFDSVVIQNYSDKDLIVNAIQSIRAASGIQTNPTIITIENIGNSTLAGNPDLILKGEINNPHDRTIIYSAGNITAEGTQAIITKDLSLSADQSIGSALQRVAAELTRGYSPVSTAVSSSDVALSVESEGSAFLNLSTTVLNGDNSEIDIAILKATSGEVDLKLGATIDESGSAVASQYEFSQIDVGTDLKIDADVAEIDIEADTNLSGTGSLDVVTGGSIQITEQGGGINLERAVSQNSSIMLALTDTTSSGDDLTLSGGAQINAAQDVTLLVGDNVQIADTASITAGDQLVIQGDAASKDTAGTEIDIRGTVQADTTFILGGDDDDTITVENIENDINIQGLDGDDSIAVKVSDQTIAGQPELGLIGGEGTDSVTISGSSSGDVFDIDGQQVEVIGRLATNLITVERLSVIGGEGDDTFYVSAVDADVELTLEGRQGDDTFNLGGAAQRLQQIEGEVTIEGGDDTDTLNLDNRGVGSDTQGEISATNVTGFGLGQGVAYQDIENLSIELGSGADQVSVTDTHSGETTVKTEGGDDQVTIAQIGGVTTVDTGTGSDQVTTSITESPTGLTLIDPDTDGTDDTDDTDGTGDTDGTDGTEDDRTPRGQDDSDDTSSTPSTPTTTDGRTPRGRDDSGDTASDTPSTPTTVPVGRTPRGRP